MDKQDVIKAIEAHHWDYEIEWIPSYIETIEEDGLRAIKNPRIHNVLSNKVVELTADEDRPLQHRWGKLKEFFGEVPFSLWLESAQSKLLSPLLKDDGYDIGDKYDGLAIMLNKFAEGGPLNKNIEYLEVESDEDIRRLVEVSSLIWGYPEDQEESLFNQRKSYITSPYRNGGYILALRNSQPVAYSNYRYSSDGKTMYMNGSGVLPEHRHQGIYSDMVKVRLKHAKSRKAVVATCQARQGQSSPVLRKLGFLKYSTYDYWVYNG
ncbi:GNAT family N-acetyltransferase [Bacillus sp. SCS-153A]|uniref:GNAT family N-acetyltransferase n=1 Tax=Rossellomorea sedimentorum TaxID=3115294 RepID=UPI003905EF23